MRTFRRSVAFLLALLMIGTAFVACGKEENEIDIYFIAGQSNANGTTKITNGDEIYDDFPELQQGTTHVLYAGNARSDKDGKAANRKFDWQGVTLGLGYKSTHFGPEVGMAKVLSTYYNAESGKTCGIIKMAHGGTGLCNTGGSGSNACGDWSPPSFAKWPDENLALGNKYIGGCYRAFMEEVEQRLGELAELGYTKINIKGLYWMQGCNDTWRYKADKLSYPKAFSCLVSDMRNDISEIVLSLQKNDGGASNMPFFIGTISPTYSLGSAKQGETFEDDGTLLDTAQKRNDPFIAMQKKLAADNENCYIVDNGAYPTVTYVIENEGTANQKVIYTMVGTDQSHWNQADCYAIGQNAGTLMLEKCVND